MKNKIDVYECFHVFHKMIQTQFSTNIKALRPDDGGEFFDHVLQLISKIMVLFIRQHVLLHPNKIV
jgi:hypothetical protein